VERDQPWMGALDQDDLAFVKRFVLASGSLKKVAGEYGVSYPTVRLRLDRLIAKIKVWDAYADQSGFERRLRAMFAEGAIDSRAFRRLLRAYLDEGGDGHADVDTD